MSTNRPLPLRFYMITGNLRWQTKHIGIASWKCWGQSSKSHLGPLIVLTSLESCSSMKSNWSINSCSEILHSFKKDTDQVQCHKVVSSNMVVVCVRGLRNQLHELIQTYICKLVSSLQASREKRLECYEFMDCFRSVTDHDPCFEWCEMNLEEQDEVKALIPQQMLKSLVPEQDYSNVPPPKQSKLMRFMKPHMLSSPIRTASEVDE